MDAPALPEPDLLERLVTVVDASVAEQGWYHPHVLVSVEDNGTSESFDLGFEDLPDDVHPVGYLLGFSAPPNWMAIGVVTYGWASPMDGEGTGRPSQHPARCRARVTSMVDRTGREAVTTVLEDGRVIDEPGVSVLADVLRRCIGAPTPPPPPVTALGDVIWLQEVLAVAEHTTMSWRKAAALRPDGGKEMTSWSRLRRLARKAPAYGELADWMDDGMFARWLLRDLPSITDLLDEADACLPTTLARRLRKEVGPDPVTLVM